MSPEEQARLKIDDKLTQAGWVIQDMKQLNLGAALGVAVREYPTDTGPADYVLFVNRNAVGVIEAKKDSAGDFEARSVSQPSIWNGWTHTMFSPNWCSPLP